MAHAGEFRFCELIEKPLGPHPDTLILSPSFPQLGVLPILEALTVECDKQFIGLDDTEFVVAPPETSLVSRTPVYFYGILKIESLNWLSGEGLSTLEAELRLRDEALHPHLRASMLTLKNVYGDAKGRGSTISVILKCRKSMYVEYMTSDRHKNHFLIQSSASHGNNRNRIYSVINVDGPTFQRSRNFVMRYRLWALINKIIETDANATPIHERTIPWLVERTLEKLRSDDPEFRGLVIGNDDDQERSEESSEDGEVANRPRRPRHIPQSEIKGIYASQAEWLLAQQLAPNHKNLWKVNMKEWVKFCRHIQIARKEAARHGVRWGMPFGVMRVRDVPLAERLSQYGEGVKFWEGKLRNLEAGWLSVEKKASKADSDEEIALGSRLSPEVPIVEFQYDSDFSEVSTSADSDSDEEPPNDPKLVARIPRYCWRPPHIPPGRFVWDCPGCDYYINFLDLQKEDLKPLTEELGQYLVRKKWQSIEDDEVQEAFALMAGHHYTWHMQKNGVQLVKKGNKWSVLPYEAPAKNADNAVTE